MNVLIPKLKNSKDNLQLYAFFSLLIVGVANA